MNRKIDRMPPAPTGNTAADITAVREYLVWLVEQLNWILTIIYNNQNGGT